MKNFKLLLGATALLSTGALMANAADVTDTKITTVVGLFRPANIKTTKELYFGIVEAKNSAEIVIGTSGYDENTSTSGLVFIEDGTAGEVEVTGKFADYQRMVIDLGLGTLDSYNEYLASGDEPILTFSDAQPLKDKTDSSIICGETPLVSFKQSASSDANGKITIKIGGKLVLDSQIESKIATAGRALTCEGSVIATAFADVGN